MPARREALRLELVGVDGEHRDPYQKADRQVQAAGEPDVLEHKAAAASPAGTADGSCVLSERGSDKRGIHGARRRRLGLWECVRGGAARKGLGFARSGVGLGRVTFVGCGLK